jgi:hypothetical protein
MRESESALPRHTPNSRGTTLEFDWHGGALTRTTRVDDRYKNTQNVRRFLREQCGEQFKFDVALMAWIREGHAKTMGDIADEWQRRQALP